jgi:NTP pyrophosphatase (non-canonical NTP hydrolase)
VTNPQTDGLSFSEYQRRARETERIQGDHEKAIVTYLLGLAGEAGGLLSEYKKFLRDGERYRLFDKSVAEEIGDTLWYLSAVASQLNIDLEAAARSNLEKTARRYSGRLDPAPDYDSSFPEEWRLPRRFDVQFRDAAEGAITSIDGVRVGDPLSDNTLRETAYRFHDVFHFAYASVLGWSPVTRSIMRPKRKRRIDPYDSVHDGGRAIVAEEGVALLVFSVAEKHGFYEEVTRVDSWLLDVIGRMVEGYEVEDRSPSEWEQAILAGYAAFRQIVANRGGIVRCNLDNRTIEYIKE